MRVLHVIPSMASRYGGPSIALREMSRALADARVDVSVATTDADGPGRLDVPLSTPIHEYGASVRYFSRSMPGEWKYSWSLATWLNRHIVEFDVVHVHALFSFSTLAACRLAARHGTPYVIRPLGTLGEWCLRHRGWKKRPYLELVERRHLTLAAAIHVTSNAERDAVAAVGYGDKAAVIPLGVRMTAAAPSIRMSGEPLRLLFLSRLHPVKNVPALLEAMRLATTTGARVELTVAGSGEAAYAEELRRQSRALGLEAVVRFVGEVREQAKAALLASSHALVLPSFHENFGMAIVEAIGAALPVIVSEHVAIAPDVCAAGAGIIAGTDAEALANAMRVFAEDEDRRQRMAQAAVDLARTKYSWSSTATRLLALYERVAATSSPVTTRAPEVVSA